MIQGFKLWRILPSNKVMLLGAMAIKPGSRTQIEFRYDAAYIRAGIALDPKNLPLSADTYQFSVSGRDFPGFIDDCLPDKWGERLIALSQGKRYIDKVDVINNVFKLATLSDIMIIPANEKAIIQKSITLNEFEKIISGQEICFSDNSLINKHLPLFITGGGSPGGARPKLLIDDQGEQWLYKFNLKTDLFNNAIGEWASLEVAALAGLNVAQHEIVTFGENHCLRVKRFDISKEGGRYHLLTMNSLLKDDEGRDPHIASYEDIAKLIRTYSDEPALDCQQLLGQLLINSELKNTDDHLRNFSFINKGKGWRLSPAYDIVPDLTTGKYHQIRVLNKDFLPTLDAAIEAGGALGVKAKESQIVADNVARALSQWMRILDEAGCSDDVLRSVVRPALLDAKIPVA